MWKASPAPQPSLRMMVTMGGRCAPAPAQDIVTTAANKRTERSGEEASLQVLDTLSFLLCGATPSSVEGLLPTLLSISPREAWGTLSRARNEEDKHLTHLLSSPLWASLVNSNSHSNPRKHAMSLDPSEPDLLLFTLW